MVRLSGEIFCNIARCFSDVQSRTNTSNAPERHESAVLIGTQLGLGQMKALP
jgi:hypothetical protein